MMCVVLNTRAEDITLSLPQVYCPRRLHIMGLLPRSLRDSYSVPHLGYQYITHTNLLPHLLLKLVFM